MAKGKSESKSNATVVRAAEAVGHALGSVAGTIDSLQAQHPHPADEMREAWAVGQEALAAAVAKTEQRTGAMIQKAKTVARRTKKAVTRARRKSAPAVASARRTARKVVKRAKKAVKRGRKTVRRAARRVKR